MDTIESKISQRKQFLLDENIEKLQEEFLKKKEKCSSKMTKIKPSEPIQNQSASNTNILFSSGEIKKKKGKKKIKDVITLNLPQLSPCLTQNIYKNENQRSLFSLNYDEYNKKCINKININTGLPDTFKIQEKINEKKEKELSDKNIKENSNLIINNLDEKNDEKNKIMEEKFLSKEYKEINDENEKKIQQMSKEEILEAQKEIINSIPNDLIQKFKNNFFTQQIKKSLNKKENNILNFEIKSTNKNEKEKAKLYNQENNSNINIQNDFNLNELNKKEKINNQEIIMFSYEGKIKKQKKMFYLLNNPEQKEMIDYRHLTFEQLDLENKYFSLEEITALLSSSNSLQILYALRMVHVVSAQVLCHCAETYSSLAGDVS